MSRAPRALSQRKTFRHGIDVLRSERHRIYGQHLNKVSLSPLDTERWIAEYGITTLAYSHRDTVSYDTWATLLLDEILSE